MTQQTKWGLGRLIVEVSRSNTDTRRYPPGFSDREITSLTEAATYATHNKHTGRTFMPSAVFEPAIPEIRRPQTYALDYKATGIG
jgi:hypothetical protein